MPSTSINQQQKVKRIQTLLKIINHNNLTFMTCNIKILEFLDKNEKKKKAINSRMITQYRMWSFYSSLNHVSLKLFCLFYWKLIRNSLMTSYKTGSCIKFGVFFAINVFYFSICGFINSLNFFGDIREIECIGKNFSIFDDTSFNYFYLLSNCFIFN